MDAYAVASDAEDFMSADVWSVVEADADRLLLRASELLDEKVRLPFAIDVDGLPTDPDIAVALRDACCAQLEFWAEVGEEHDTGGMANRQASIGHLSLQQLPPELGPRARRILAVAGLLTASGIDTTAARFFATQGG